MRAALTACSVEVERRKDSEGFTCLDFVPTVSFFYELVQGSCGGGQKLPFKYLMGERERESEQRQETLPNRSMMTGIRKEVIRRREIEI